MARLQKLLLLSSISILTTQAIADPAWGDWQSNTEEPPTADTRPNVVFILTDDQDLHLNSLEYMPFLQKHLVEQGTSYQRHYCTIAVCCPSRVSLWTGQAAHNTNVTDVSPPYGTYPSAKVCAHGRLNSSQVGIPSSSVKDTTRRGFLYGCRKLGIIRTILGSSSTPIRLIIMTLHFPRALPDLRICWTLLRIYI